MVKMKLNKNILVGVLILLVIAIISINFYFLAEKEREIEKDYCEQDSDCVWAVRPNECCICPSIYNQKIVDADRGLVAYEQGKDYSLFRTNECVDINCVPCNPTVRELKCINNKCASVEKPPYENYCETNNDCVPNACCHPSFLVNKYYTPDCSGSRSICTAVCSGPLDCRSWEPTCEDNICGYEIK